MHEWKLKKPYLCVACFLEPSTENLFDINSKNLANVFEYLNAHGAWHVCRYEQSGKVFTLAFYRYRVLIIYQPEGVRYIGTDEAIRNIFLPVYQQEVANLIELIKKCFGEAIREVFHYPLVIAPEFDMVRASPLDVPELREVGWLDDGVTTHYYRIFDSYNNKIGFIRISKWLTISYGLNDNINRELVNLIYEKILHGMRKRGESDVSMGEDEISLLDGLSRFTVPTELNLFVQGLALRVAVFLTIIGILLSILEKGTSHFSSQTTIILYVLFILMIPVIWRLLHALVRFK